MALAAVIFAKIGQIFSVCVWANRSLCPARTPSTTPETGVLPERPLSCALLMIFEGGFYVPKHLGKNGGSH
jgi:hypothetical protein